MITLDEAKNYLRVEYEDDDDFIEEIIQVADGYIRDGVSNYAEKFKNKDFRLKARLCERALIQNMYDERYLLSYRQSTTYMIAGLIHQMEYGNYPPDDGGACNGL